MKLFQRDGKVKITTYKLTTKGTEVYDKIKPFFDTFPYELEEDIFESKIKTSQEKITLATSPGIIQFILKKFFNKLPINLYNSLNLVQLNSNTYFSDLFVYKNEIIDIVIDTSLPDKTNTVSEELCKINFCFLATKEYLQKNSLKNSNDLKKHNVYMFSRIESHLLHKKLLSEVNVNFIQDFPTLINLLENNSGIVFLPETYKKISSKNIIGVLNEFMYSQEIYLYYKKRDETKNILPQMLDLIRKNLIK